MNGWMGNEGRTEKQLCRSTLHHGKSARLFVGMRQASDGTFRKLKPFSKAFKVLPFYRARLGESM